MKRLASIVVFASIALCAVACGKSDEKAADESGDGTGAAAAAEEAKGPAAPPPAKASKPVPEKVAPPAEDHGYVVNAGKRSELKGDDFAICEPVNPGIKGDFNIMAKLADGTRFRLSGNVNEDNSADHRGLVLGEMPNEVKATNLKVELDGRTLSGTAETDAGPIEFSFEC